MSQLKELDPQFECGRYEIWCGGIFNSLSYKVFFGPDTYITFMNADILEERLTFDDLHFPELRKTKPEEYETVVSTVGSLVKKVCSEISDPCDKLLFHSRFIELIFLHILKEHEILTEPTKYYYESVMDIFSKTNFGLAFFIDLIKDLTWYKHGSKILTRFSDPTQVNTILARLNELSCDVHLSVLFVIWGIEATLNDPESDEKLLKFKIAAKQLLEQLDNISLNARESIGIFFAVINVFVEEFIGSSARQAAREMGINVAQDPNDFCPKLVLNSVKIYCPPLQVIYYFVRSLEESLFSSERYKNVPTFVSCREDPKFDSIFEMTSSISELYEFLCCIAENILDLPLSEVYIGCFTEWKASWKLWKDRRKLLDFHFWEILSLKRFFTPDREESRFLIITILKYGLPKYFDVLEVVESEAFLDPYVMHYLAFALNNADDSEQMDDLILILQRVLKSIKSRKRISAFMNARVKLFGLYTYGKPHLSNLPLLLKHGKSGAILYDQVRDDIILSTYLCPYNFLEKIVSDALEHCHSMLPFLCKIFCVELAPICSSIVGTRFGNTCLEVLLNGRLQTTPSEATVHGLMIIIKEIHTYYFSAKNPIMPPVMTLEKLSLTLAWDACCDPELSVSAKISVFKLIQGLSDSIDNPWKQIQDNPQHIIYNLLTLIDYVWYDGSKKVDIIAMIEYIMEKKVQRKITKEEYHWMRRRVEHHEEEPMLFAYINPWLEVPLSIEVKDEYIKKMMRHQFLLFVAILKDNLWLRWKHHHDLRCTTRTLKEGIGTILRLLYRPEFDNLFYFLSYHNPIQDVVRGFTEGYLSQDEYSGVNTQYVTNCVIDCIEFHINNYYKTPSKYISGRRPLTPREDLLVITFEKVGFMYFFSQATAEDEKRISTFLHKIAREMKSLNMDIEQNFFSSEPTMARQAYDILAQYFGPMYYYPKRQPIRVVPI